MESASVCLPKLNRRGTNVKPKTLADLPLRETATITVRIVDNSSPEFLVVEFGGIFRTVVMTTSASKMGIRCDQAE